MTAERVTTGTYMRLSRIPIFGDRAALAGRTYHLLLAIDPALCRAHESAFFVKSMREKLTLAAEITLDLKSLGLSQRVRSGSRQAMLADTIPAFFALTTLCAREQIDAFTGTFFGDVDSPATQRAALAFIDGIAMMKANVESPRDGLEESLRTLVAEWGLNCVQSALADIASKESAR